MPIGKLGVIMAVKKTPAKAKKKSAKKTPASAAKKKASPVKKTALKKPAAKKLPAKKQPAVKPAEAQSTPRSQCQVVEMGGNSFIIVVGKARNFFDLSEMRILVNISHAASDEKDGAARLFRWLGEHRKDVLIDTEIANALDPALTGIYNYLITHYSVRK
jgi:hypothetical protein